MSSAPAARKLLTLGLDHRREGRLDEAKTAFIDAVTAAPDLTAACFELGTLLEQQGDLPAAALCFEQCTDLELASFEHQLHLARCLRRSGKHERALAHYQCARILRPASLEAMRELANLLLSLRRFDPALSLFRRAVQQAPDLGPLHHELGRAYEAKHLPDLAIESYRRALELEPSSGEFRRSLGHALFDTGDVHGAMLTYRRALELEPDHAAGRANVVYALAFDPNADSAAIFRAAREWGERHAAPLMPAKPEYTNAPEPERRLRVGYVSPDFRQHCQSFFTTPLFEHHDRDGFEIFCYSSTDRPDANTERLRRSVAHWRETGTQDDVSLAETIRADRVDILVDLTMFMQDGRPLLFARKPAPLQVCWLAYPGTTGNPGINYRISDRFIDPPELGGGAEDRLYTERSLRLPDTFWCYNPLCSEPDVSPLPAARRGYVTFGCLNSFAKTNEGVFVLWAAVLRRLPSSRLVLLAPAGEARRRTAAVFAREGIDPSRIDFLDRQPREKYLATYREIDVCLDTLPYNGHTTSLDACWMGVPVVTLVGKTVVGRAGLCLAQNLDLPGLIAQTTEEFVERCVELTADRDALADLRRNLRARMERSPLMDGARFARNLEKLYRDIWRGWCSESIESNG